MFYIHNFKARWVLTGFFNFIHPVLRSFSFAFELIKPMFCLAPYIKSALEHNTITYNTTQKRSEPFVLKHNNLLWTLPQNTAFCSFSLSTPLRLEMSPFFPKVLKWAHLSSKRNYNDPIFPMEYQYLTLDFSIITNSPPLNNAFIVSSTYRLPSMTKSPIIKKDNEPLFPCILQI